MPLPPRPYELSTWKIATVGPNYHISVEKMNYSVPYEYIKQKVDVRITKSTIEVFFGGNRICSHPRLYGRANQYSTTESHMPENHQQYIQWNGDRFCKWAAQIGPNTNTSMMPCRPGNVNVQPRRRHCSVSSDEGVQLARPRVYNRGDIFTIIVDCFSLAQGTVRDH